MLSGPDTRARPAGVVHMTTSIAKLVSVRQRYVRSVDIPRDLEDPEALEGYVVTPSARDAAIRITRGLDTNSRQRAFRVVGSYGCGKSAFGLFLARLLKENGKGEASTLLTRMGVNLPTTAKWHPVVIGGRRVSFSSALLRSVTSAHSALDVSLGLQDKAEVPEMLGSDGPLDALSVTGIVGEIAGQFRSKTGAGLLLIIDEMGRFLEYAAAHPESEDPSVFQALAERSGGRAGCDLAVIGILHHSFADYVSGLGAWIEAEWSRVSSRYEEVRFDSSTEQSLFMIARALKQPCNQDDAVRHCATHYYSESVDRGVFAANHEDVVSIAPGLYPLHPAAVATMSSAISRFGQNERSLFSFLQSLEPDGFQRFALSTAYDAANWYRTSNAFDHLAATVAEIASNDRGRRWSRALDAVRAAAGIPTLNLDVLKTVALTSILEPVPGIVADVGTIAWCLDREQDEVSSVLESLTSRGLIYCRTHRNDYSLWSNSSVDLSRWLDDAKANVPPPRRFDDVSALPRTGRPMVAHRHYHQTGTLRTFDVRLWSNELRERGNGDGQVLIAPVYPHQDHERILSNILAEVGDDPLTLICLRKVSTGALMWTHELALWDWIKTNCPDLRVDELARTEVSERVAAAERALERCTAVFTTIGTEEDLGWWVGGVEMEALPGRLSSSVLSELCDRTFDQAPNVRNEIVNRDKLTSAAATARMRLLHAMLTNPKQERLGIEGTPPELAMYLSLFYESGIHRAGEDGTFAFREPSDIRWEPIWTHIERCLSNKKTKSFESLMRELHEPPFGLRYGPSLPIIAAYVLASGDRIAVLERSTFVPDLTVPHFMRLAKAPRNFAIGSLSEPADRPGLIPELATGLSVIGAARPAIADIAAKLYHWFNQLTPYAMQTRSVSPIAIAVREQLRKASDPGELFFRQLARACAAPDRDSGSLRACTGSYATVLDAALIELDQAVSNIRSQAIDSVLKGFCAEDVNSLRSTLKHKFEPFAVHLDDHRLEVFLDRACRDDVNEEVWLDGIAGHLVGNRPTDWTDRTISKFDLEIRIVASNLAKWLALAQTAQGSVAGLRSVHVVGLDGTDRMLVLSNAKPDRSLKAGMEVVRKALHEHPYEAEVLARLLEEFIDGSTSYQRTE